MRPQKKPKLSIRFYNWRHRNDKRDWQFIEQQEAAEGIYHGVGGCDDKSHGHPVKS